MKTILYLILAFVAVTSMASQPPPVLRNPVSTNVFPNQIDGVVITDDNGLPFLIPPPLTHLPFLSFTGGGISGNVPSWQMVDMGADVTGILAASFGGTGLNAVTAGVSRGSILTSASNGHWGDFLADVSVGSLLISGGTGQKPVWGTGSPPLTISGSQIGFGNQNPNVVLAGPISGFAAPPNFRGLSLNDANGSVPTIALFNGSPIYAYANTNSNLNLRRVSCLGAARVEYVMGSGGTGLSTMGNQATTTGTAAGLAGLNGIPGGIRFFSAASSSSTAGINGVNSSIGWNLPTHFLLVGNFTNTTSSRFVCGMTSGSFATVITSSDPNTTHSAFIQYDSTVRSTYNFYTSDGSSSTVTDSGVTATTNLATYEIIWDIVNTRMVAFRNGIPLATNTTHLPAAAMKTIVGVFTGQNQAMGVDIYHSELDQDFSPSIP
jgi:hypothetical protein